VGKKLVLARVNLPIRVYDLVKRRIVSNELPFGTKLSEDNLATQLGVSRTPVREALNRLAQEGLVTVSPGRGASVATFSFDDMVQLLEIREALEGMAARLASSLITKSTLNKLRELLEVGAPERERNGYNGYTGYLDADREFHEAITSACGNRHLSHLMRSLRDRIQMLRYRSVILPGRARKSFQEHVQILDALNRRDADCAEERIRTHIRNVQSDLRAALGNSSEGHKEHRTNGAYVNGAKRWKRHVS
jgi:DNA-binding GntR family transcriptional regulator